MLDLITKVVRVIFISFAVTGIIAFERRLSGKMKSSRPFPKLLALKSLVFIDFLQTLVFAGLQKVGVGAKDTPRLSYIDFKIGLPATIFEMEMILFALFFIWAFSITPYRRALNQPDLTGQITKRQNPFFGIMQALNPLDIMSGIWTAAVVLSQLPFGKRFLRYEAKCDLSAQPKPALVVSPQSSRQSLNYSLQQTYQLRMHPQQDLPQPPVPLPKMH